MLEVRKLGSPVALIFGIRIEFPDLLFLDKFMTVSLALLLSPPTISLLSILNVFEAKFNNLVVFNKEISGAATLPKSLMKR